jgi:hypothetical protein
MDNEDLRLGICLYIKHVTGAMSPDLYVDILAGHACGGRNSRYNIDQLIWLEIRAQRKQPY